MRRQTRSRNADAPPRPIRLTARQRQTAAAATVLESLGGQGGVEGRPVAALPLDREKLSNEAMRAVEEGIADHTAGRTHTADNVKEELGI